MTPWKKILNPHESWVCFILIHNLYSFLNGSSKDTVCTLLSRIQGTVVYGITKQKLRETLYKATGLIGIRWFRGDQVGPAPLPRGLRNSRRKITKKKSIVIPSIHNFAYSVCRMWMPSACLFNKNTLNDALEICMLDDPYILHYDVWTFCIICFVKSDHPLLSDHHIRFYIFLTSQPLIDQTAILQKLTKNCIYMNYYFCLWSFY